MGLLGKPTILGNPHIAAEKKLQNGPPIKREGPSFLDAVGSSHVIAFRGKLPLLVKKTSLRSNTRWWQLKSFSFSPLFGEMIKFDEDIFQRG